MSNSSGMKLARPVVGLVAVAAVAAFALPSQAAGRTAALYFDDQGSTSGATCTPAFVLTKAAPAQPMNYCGNTRLGYSGNGDLPADDYTSQSSAVGFTLNAKKPVTGTVYLAGYPPISGGIGPAQSPRYTPGPVGATITISVNGIKLPAVTSSGVEMPNATYAIPIKVKLPAKLDKKVVKSVVADIQYTTDANYVGGVSRDQGSQSKLVFATR
jgi:hypothetical protein